MDTSDNRSNYRSAEIIILNDANGGSDYIESVGLCPNEKGLL